MTWKGDSRVVPSSQLSLPSLLDPEKMTSSGARHHDGDDDVDNNNERLLLSELECDGDEDDHGYQVSPASASAPAAAPAITLSLSASATEEEQDSRFLLQLHRKSKRRIKDNDNNNNQHQGGLHEAQDRRVILTAADFDSNSSSPSNSCCGSYHGIPNPLLHPPRLQRRPRLRRGEIIGGLIAILALILFIFEIYTSRTHFCSTDVNGERDCPTFSSFRGGGLQRTTYAIYEYLELFGGNHKRQSHASVRNLASEGSSRGSQRFHPQLVIAGKMTVEEGPCNIAQYNLKTKQWSLSERIQLSLYNSYSGGEVYSLLANHSFQAPKRTSYDNEDNDSSSSGTVQYGSGELIVVGAFDTTYRNSQVTYCSVGKWDGLHLSKVGEGLCNSALSKGMKITTSALAGPQDVYVAGSFQTQVWNGDRHEFVKIFNIAHFNAAEQVWLPLNVGQITCSWCTVTVLALAWDSKRRQLHVAGKFNAIDGRNVPAGLAIYDWDSGHLVAHPGGGLCMRNLTQDGVGTALQLDQERGVLYVMGSFERLTYTQEVCLGLAAYEINTNKWTCLADAAHTVLPTGGGNMLLTQYGLMVAGKTTSSTTWPDNSRPYTIALLNATLKEPKRSKRKGDNDDDGYEDDDDGERGPYHNFSWSWLPGFRGHDEPLHALSNGFGDYEGNVFIAGDNLVAKWSYQLNSGTEREDGWKSLSSLSSLSSSSSSLSSSSSTTSSSSSSSKSSSSTSSSSSTLLSSVPPSYNKNHRALPSSSSSSYTPQYIAVTETLSDGHVRGAIMAISQMMPEPMSPPTPDPEPAPNLKIIIYCVAAGCVIGIVGAVLCNRNVSSSVFPFIGKDPHLKGISLDTLTYSALENTNITDAYQRAMKTRYVQHPHLLTIIDPQEIFLQRIIGEGTFGRVWSAKWRSASVAVKEFVFAQAAVAGKSSMQQEIVEEIIGEAGMMAILRHPNVLQLFGCSLTAQAIWIVSELCSLGSLRQVLDDNERVLSVETRLSLALQVAEGMTYLHNQDPPIIHRDLKSHNIFVHETFTEIPEVSPKKRLIGSWISGGKSNSSGTNSSPSEENETNNSSWFGGVRRAGEPEKMTTHSTVIAKIGDWGSARATLSGSRTMTHGVGTACWLAPEVIKHARSSKYSDVYGYGIVLWELATREEVYQGLETTQIIAKVANESLRPPVPQGCPWKDLMVKCWEENPHDRLEFGEIVQDLNAISLEMEGGLISDTTSDPNFGSAIDAVDVDDSDDSDDSDGANDANDANADEVDEADDESAVRRRWVANANDNANDNAKDQKATSVPTSISTSATARLSNSES